MINFDTFLNYFLMIFQNFIVLNIFEQVDFLHFHFITLLPLFYLIFNENLIILIKIYIILVKVIIENYGRDPYNLITLYPNRLNYVHSNNK